MKKKSGILLLMAMCFVFLSLSFVSAGLSFSSSNLTVVTPGASGTLGGSSAVFNVTSVAGYKVQNWTRIRVYLQSAGLTANTTERLATGWIKNTSTLMFNGTLNSKVFEDGTDYTFKAQLSNGSNTVNITRTSVNIDNTRPSSPTLTLADQTEVKSSTTQTFTGTVTDANTTSCTYTIARGGATSGSDYFSGTGTYATTSCTFTKSFTTSTDNGIWYWTMTASDGTNTSTSGTNKLVVNLPGAGGGSTGEGTLDFLGTEGNLWIWIVSIIVVVIFVIVIYLVFW